MGEIYCRSIFGMKHPRVGLLSIGEEEGKGNDLTREAFQLLKRLPINFIGNVEGRDLYNGHVDVIVADGFVGNVALKTSEGVARLVRTVLKETLKATITRQVGAYAFAQRIFRFQEAAGSHRIWRRAAAGHKRRVHHHARIVEYECHQERGARGGGICRRQGERDDRAGTGAIERSG